MKREQYNKERTKNSKFRFLIEVLNELYSDRPKCSVIIRRETLMNCFEYPDFYTIDVYRRILTLAGYLGHAGRGCYEMRERIPITLTKSYCYKLAYPKVTTSQN